MQDQQQRKYFLSEQLFNKALQVIPGGVQTLAQVVKFGILMGIASQILLVL